MRKNNNHLSAPQSGTWHAKEVVQSKHIKLEKQTSDLIAGGYNLCNRARSYCWMIPMGSHGHVYCETRWQRVEERCLGDRVGICGNIFSHFDMNDQPLRSHPLLSHGQGGAPGRLRLCVRRFHGGRHMEWASGVFLEAHHNRLRNCSLGWAGGASYHSVQRPPETIFAHECSI